ncbi:MAG: hypothetical protein ACM3WV_01440 [Bacillota bacterium]
MSIFISLFNVLAGLFCSIYGLYALFTGRFSLFKKLTGSAGRIAGLLLFSGVSLGFLMLVILDLIPYKDEYKSLLLTIGAHWIWLGCLLAGILAAAVYVGLSPKRPVYHEISVPRESNKAK